jgi:uncharacterized membrane protein (UPF0136 family)
MTSPMLNTAAGLVTFVFGLLALSGGVQGFVRKGSRSSLIAGGISGLLLILCGVLDWLALWYGAVGAIVVAVLMKGRFVGTMIKEHRVAGGVLNTKLGRVAVAIVLMGLMTVLLNTVALIQ